jgi:hypothetical protein
MNQIKRQARAKARAKTNRLVRMGVPFTVSKWHYMSTWRYPGTPGEWQSMRKTHTWAKTRRFVRSQVRDSAA